MNEKSISPTACCFLMIGMVVVLTSSRDIQAADRPNIVLIMADDMGYSDIGCYGGEIDTPHIDHLAAEGLRFAQFYNCAVCGTTRASLMTGLYHHQVGVRTWNGVRNDRCVNIGEALHEALFWELGGHRAVRMGNWKLVGRKGSPWELYDLEADWAEANDLAQARPDLVEKLAAMYRQWAERCSERR